MILEGKNAIITGANRGIGNAVLQAFAEEGANVWAFVRKPNDEFSEQCRKLSKSNGVQIEIIKVDIADATSLKTAIQQVAHEKRSIDVLVNNAGIVGPNHLFQMTPMDDMRKVFEVNFFATMSVIQLVSRAMAKQGSGSIVNMGSVAGLDGNPGQLEYAASKGAVITATKKLAIELGDKGIRVNSVAPGATDTSMLGSMSKEMRQAEIERTILRRLGKPEEIANVVAFLASDKSAYITGQVVRVDGGRI